MKARCYNPKTRAYHRYGGRGIFVCDEWLNSFSKFINDVGPRPSTKHQIERVNNNGPYSADNCKWVTNTEQSRNRSTNKIITFNGESLTVTEWGRKLGLNRGAITKRLNGGWSEHKALTTLKLPRNKRQNFNPR